jgi:hypothetical protein
VEHWFLSYVELLQRFQLFTKANEVGVAFFDIPDTFTLVRMESPFAIGVAIHYSRE